MRDRRGLQRRLLPGRHHLPRICTVHLIATDTGCSANPKVGAQCHPDLVCGATVLSPLTLRCLVPVSPGGACTVGRRQCLGGTHCLSASQASGSAGSCVADAPVGAASGVCDLAAAEPRGCLGGFCATANGTCTSFIPESLPCLSTDQCGPGGLCNAGVAVCYKSCAP